MSSSASSHKGEKEEDVEEFDPDVEEIEKGDCAARLRGLLLRVILSLIVIGACSGVLYWSFKRNESDVEQKTHPITAKDVSVYINQYTTKGGTYSITYREPDTENNNNIGKPAVSQSWWIQDNDEKRLVHRKDNQTTGYIFEHYSYWATYDSHGDIKNCRYDPQTNYQIYINRMGFANLTQEHSAYEKTHNHQQVYIFNGDPSDVIVEGTPQDAFLVTVYADAFTGVLLGWDTYFTSSTNSSLVYLISYWYDSMTKEKPPESDFDPPAECQPIIM